MDDFRLAEMIISVVARAGGVKVAQLRSHSTQATISKLRDTTRYLIRQRTGLSFPEIGRLFKQDHSSVLVAVRREQMRLDRRLTYPHSNLTWSAWHGHILALLDQELAELAAAAAAPKEGSVEESTP